MSEASYQIAPELIAFLKTSIRPHLQFTKDFDQIAVAIALEQIAVELRQNVATIQPES